MVNTKITKKIDPRIKKVLISEKELSLGITKAAKWIDKNYKNGDLIIISILKGSVPFVGTLIPQITIDFQVDFLSVSSFKGGIKAATSPEILSKLNIDIRNKDILIVEDIVDSGKTISHVMHLLNEQKPKSVKLLTLLDKPEGREIELKADYACFTIPLLFIVGFGLDYGEYLRNLPYIAELKEEVYLNKK